MKGKLLVYLGGIRSGKSRLAEARFSKELKGRRLKGVYLATLDSRLIKGDAPMQARIREHRRRRPTVCHRRRQIHRVCGHESKGRDQKQGHLRPPRCGRPEARRGLLLRMISNSPKAP